MDNTSTPYTSLPYRTPPTFGGVSWAELLLEAGLLKHEDIPTFSFAPLDQIRKDLLGAGHSVEEVESTIAGLSELPEYAKGKRNQKRKA